MNLISKFWLLLCLCSFALLAYRTFDLSPYLEIRSYQTENRLIKISFYACFKLELKNENCSISSDASQPKREFTCDFQRPIACYTKGLQAKSPKEIIGLFKRCNLARLVQPKLDRKGYGKNGRIAISLVDNSELRLFFDQVCLVIVYQFDTANMSKKSEPAFYFGADHQIPYSVKAVIDYGLQSGSHFIPIFKR